MSEKELPSPELLRKLLRYEPDTGKLYWRERTKDMFADNKRSAEWNCSVWNSKMAWTEAFTCCSHGYKQGRIFKKAFAAHRVAWAIYHNEWPDGQIDHINGDRSDNKISNLRVVSVTDNNRNMAISKRNTSGVVGVYMHKPTQKWIASICHQGKSIHLGYFEDKEAAILARKSAEIDYGYHSNHGRTISEPADVAKKS